MGKFNDNTRPKKCPWGPMLQIENVATGIWRVDCASNGGYYISSERVDAMPEALRHYTPNARDYNGILYARWYEERIDWCIVCLAFPNDFTRNKGLAERAGIIKLAKHTCDVNIADPVVRAWLETQP